MELTKIKFFNLKRHQKDHFTRDPPNISSHCKRKFWRLILNLDETFKPTIKFDWRIKSQWYPQDPIKQVISPFNNWKTNITWLWWFFDKKIRCEFQNLKYLIRKWGKFNCTFYVNELNKIFKLVFEINSEIFLWFIILKYRFI